MRRLSRRRLGIFLALLCHPMSQGGEDPGQATPLEGRYANTFQVGHNAFEFFLDFGQVSPETETPRFHTRIITGPAYAKAFAEVLHEALLKYEATFGAIHKGDS